MPYPFHGCDMTVVEDESESIHVFGDPNAAGGFTLTLDRGWIEPDGILDSMEDSSPVKPVDLVRTSKFLSLVLRHRPDRIGLTLDPQGWARVDELIEAAQRARVPL